MALFNGLAYVADGESGLQVLNYLAFDTAGAPPSIELALTGNAVEEGQFFRMTANVNDDVQVRVAR